MVKWPCAKTADSAPTRAKGGAHCKLCRHADFALLVPAFVVIVKPAHLSCWSRPVRDLCLCCSSADLIAFKCAGSCISTPSSTGQLLVGWFVLRHI